MPSAEPSARRPTTATRAVPTPKSSASGAHTVDHAAIHSNTGGADSSKRSHTQSAPVSTGTSLHEGVPSVVSPDLNVTADHAATDASVAPQQQLQPRHTLRRATSGARADPEFVFTTTEVADSDAAATVHQPHTSQLVQVGGAVGGTVGPLQTPTASASTTAQSTSGMKSRSAPTAAVAEHGVVIAEKRQAVLQTLFPTLPAAYSPFTPTAAAVGAQLPMSGAMSTSSWQRVRDDNPVHFTFSQISQSPSEAQTQTPHPSSAEQPPAIVENRVARLLAHSASAKSGLVTPGSAFSKPAPSPLGSGQRAGPTKLTKGPLPFSAAAAK